jgi:hypothetical protein
MSGPIVLALRALMALSLYTFLGWTFYTLWRDLQQEAHKLTSRRAPGMHLSIRDGEAPPVSKYFIQSEVTLGRDPICDLTLTDETASARHARLSYHHGQWWVEDLGSMNGTFLNQEKLAVPAVLTTGDEIRCGNARLAVNLAVEVFPSETLQITEE